MTKRTLIQNTRKWHRYLGLLLGIQFLLWTIGGLYFSWTNIDEIRGDNLKNETKELPDNANFISPSAFLPKLLKDKWRIFDFLWMLHTMDYQERDNFNNWLLRAFSIFGIFTILSGFSLYILTSKKYRSRKISKV